MTIAHPVPSTITFTAPPSSSSHFDSLLTRHNTSLVLLTFATSDPFTVACQNITFSLQDSVFHIHLSATPTLSLFVSGYCSAVDHRISITSYSSCSPKTQPARIHRIIDDLKFCATSQSRSMPRVQPPLPTWARANRLAVGHGLEVPHQPRATGRIHLCFRQ